MFSSSLAIWKKEKVVLPVLLIPSQDMRYFCLYLHQMVQHSKQVASRIRQCYLKEGVPLPMKNLTQYFSCEVIAKGL